MNELEHYGIKGQEWGNRRFQYEDGTLTPEGRIRYSRHTSLEKYANVRSNTKTAKVYKKYLNLRPEEDLDYESSINELEQRVYKIRDEFESIIENRENPNHKYINEKGTTLRETLKNVPGISDRIALFDSLNTQLSDMVNERSKLLYGEKILQEYMNKLEKAADKERRSNRLGRMYRMT